MTTMSIEVQSVSKLYGAQRALDQVSFAIARGEVVGFLGPNGAGKSTMMKILTCYIPPTDGRAQVCGFDVMEQSMEVRRRVGYLPEHNPLYTDMYVREYLAFTGELYKVKNVRKRVDEMIDLVGLGVEAHKKIEALSKGYRQRVGLAQAMIHDPEVLILDEPTSGLDPNQLSEVRTLIKNIGREKTVMLSTHIMQEVEAICSRTIIINRGRIVTDRPTAELKSGLGTYTLVVETDRAIETSALLLIEGVKNVLTEGELMYLIETSTPADLRGEVSRVITTLGATVLTLNRRELKLEEIFRELTADPSDSFH